MPVLDVTFDGDPSELQDDLDNADLEADVDVQGDAPAGAAGGRQEEGGGTPIGTRTAIVGAITAIVGLLVPIKEILEGIQNFFLVALAPVFTALRPLIDTVRKILLSIARFIAGDLSLEDIGQTIVDSFQSLLEGRTFETPLGSFSFGSQNGTKTGRRANQGETDTVERIRQIFELTSPSGAASIGQNYAQNYVADRTDEAQKDRQSNANGNTNSSDYGGWVQLIDRTS